MLDSEEIAKEFKESTRKFKGCFYKALSKNPAKCLFKQRASNRGKVRLLTPDEIRKEYGTMYNPNNSVPENIKAILIHSRDRMTQEEIVNSFPSSHSRGSITSSLTRLFRNDSSVRRQKTRLGFFEYWADSKAKETAPSHQGCPILELLHQGDVKLEISVTVVSPFRK